MPKAIKQCKKCNPFLEMMKHANFSEEEMYGKQNLNYNNFWYSFLCGSTLRIWCNNEKYNEYFNNNICPFCQGQLIDINMNYDEFKVLGKASNYNRQLLEAMIELKQKDIIEYELKMSQFRTQVEQQKQAKEQARVVEQKTSNNTINKPKCPHCSSTNISKISGTERAVSIVGLGIFSKKINKSFKCKSCGYTW